MGGGDTGENGVFLDEFGVIGVLNGGEVYAAGVFDADLLGNSLDGGKVVARDNLNGDIVVVEVIDDFFDVFAEFVLE